MQKHKFPSISLTMRDRAISSKFSIHWVSPQSTQFCPSTRAQLMLSFGWTLRMPMCPISILIFDEYRIKCEIFFSPIYVFFVV